MCFLVMHFGTSFSESPLTSFFRKYIDWLQSNRHMNSTEIFLFKLKMMGKELPARVLNQ